MMIIKSCILIYLNVCLIFSQWNKVGSSNFPLGNLILNGGFENNFSKSQFSGWTPIPNNGMLDYSNLNSTPPMVGSGMVSVSVNGDGNRHKYLISNVFKLEPGEYYSLFLRYQSSASDNIGPIIELSDRKLLDENNEFDTFIEPFPVQPKYQANSEWANYSYHFFVPTDFLYGRVILIEFSGTGLLGEVQIDEVSMVKGCVLDAGENTSNCPNAPAYGNDNRHPDFHSKSTKFYNGKNKIVQSQIKNENNSIVTQYLYDDFNRITKSSLPISVSNSEQIHINVEENLPNHYNTSDNLPNANGFPFEEVTYEDNPLGRKHLTAKSGGPWSIEEGIPTETRYGSVTDLSTEPAYPLPAVFVSGAEYFVKEFIDSDGRISREYMDKMGRIVRNSTLGDNGWVQTSYSYDAQGNLIQALSPLASDGLQLSSTMKYDARGRTIEETTDATGTTKFWYDDLDRVRFVQTQKQFDQDVGHHYSYIKYDPLGRIVETGDATCECDVFTFNDILPNNVNDQTFPNNGDIRYTYWYDKPHYDPETSCFISNESIIPGNFLVKPIDENAEGVEFESLEAAYAAILDPANGYTAQEYPQGIIIYQLFTPGNDVLNSLSGFSLSEPPLQVLIKSIEKYGQEHLSILNGEPEWGKLKGHLVNVTSYFPEFDGIANIEGRILSKTFNYDKYGNVTEIFEYNEFINDPGQRCQVVKNDYDVSNRLIKKIDCMGKDCEGNPASIEEYSYDKMGRMDKIEFVRFNNGAEVNRELILSNDFDQIGRLSSQNIGGDNPFTVSYNYHLHGYILDKIYTRDSDGHLLFNEKLSYEEDPTNPLPSGQGELGGNISRANYTFSSSLENANILNLQYDYSYDNLSRLYEAQVNGNEFHNMSEYYEYFEDGRIAYMEKGAVHAGGYQYNSSGQLTDILGDLGISRHMAGPGNFQYDANGNLIKDISKLGVNENLAEYRSDNMPTHFRYEENGNLHDVYMVYDESGNRAAKIDYLGSALFEAQYYFSDGKEIRLNNGGTYSEHYKIAGMGRIVYDGNQSRWEKEFYLTNHLGNTMEIYNETEGAITYAVQYTPFGREENETDEGIEKVTPKFTGKELDEGIELSYFGARYYDADIGMWISPDPARQFHSLYAYTGNGYNPINGYDPNGLEYAETKEELDAAWNKLENKNVGILRPTESELINAYKSGESIHRVSLVGENRTNYKIIVFPDGGDLGYRLEGTIEYTTGNDKWIKRNARGIKNLEYSPSKLKREPSVLEQRGLFEKTLFNINKLRLKRSDYPNESSSCDGCGIRG